MRCEVILVDNGSSDGSVTMVRQKFPGLTVIEAQGNLGYAAGNNLGVERAAGSWIVLLNNDTIVEKGWLSGLVRALEAPNVAVASSLIRTRGIPDRYYERNGTINFVGHNIMRAFDKPTEIFFAGGASLIFKRDILGKPFDDDYFAYAEDVYLSLRARFLGYEVKHVAESIVRHFGGGTSQHEPSQRMTFYQERNRLMNMFIFFDSWTLVRLVPFFIANVVVKMFYALFSKRLSAIGILRCYAWLLLHLPAIRNKRRVLRREKMVPDATVIRAMSGRVSNGEHLAAEIANFCSLAYCRLVGLRTIEFQGN